MGVMKNNEKWALDKIASYKSGQLNLNAYLYRSESLFWGNEELRILGFYPTLFEQQDSWTVQWDCLLGSWFPGC